MTGAARLPYKGIMHVAGLNWWWTANRNSEEVKCKTPCDVFRENGFQSIAFPLIGAGTGTGGVSPQATQYLMLEELRKFEGPGEVRLLIFRPV